VSIYGSQAQGYYSRFRLSPAFLSRQIHITDLKDNKKIYASFCQPR